jgi:hypothetical protein
LGESPRENERFIDSDLGRGGGSGMVGVRVRDTVLYSTPMGLLGLGSLIGTDEIPRLVFETCSKTSQDWSIVIDELANLFILLDYKLKI